MLAISDPATSLNAAATKLARSRSFLVGIDIGSTVGVAVSALGRPIYESIPLPADLSYGGRMSHWGRHLRRLLCDFRARDLPARIIIERSAPAKHALRDLYIGLHQLTLMHAYESRIGVTEIAATSARKAVFGHGLVSRDSILPLVQGAFPDVATKHEADALVQLLAYLEIQL